MEFAVAQFFNKARQNHAFASVTYKIRRTDFSVRTEKGEFSRLSLLRLNTYSARKEGKTEPQAGAITTIAESSLCFIV